MATIVVTPQTFELVEFAAPDIEAAAAEVADRVGLGDDATVEIEIDEAVIAPRVVATADPSSKTIKVETTSGALEDLRKARVFSPERAQAQLAHALMRARDRFDDAFGDPPADDDLTVEQETAWATYIEGRLERAGFPARRPRRIYHFRVRHGFTDGVDEAFEQLWSGDNLTWADIERISNDAQATGKGAAVPA